MTTVPAFAQKDEKRLIDSLKKVASSHVHDSIRMKALRKWDDLIYLSDPEMDFKLNLRMKELGRASLKKKLTSKETYFFRKYLASAHNNLGIIYMDRGNYVDATSNYYDAIKLQEKINDLSSMGKAYGNLALIYQNQNDFEKAKELLEKSLAMRMQIKDSAGIAYAYANIGMNYRGLGKPDSVLVYFQRALKIRLKLGNPLQTAYSLNDMASVYKDKREYELTLKYLRDAYTYFKKAGDNHSMAASHMNIGTVLFEMKKFDEALASAKASLELGLKLNDMMYMRDINFLLYGTYKKKGNFELAMKAYEKYIVYRDSIASDQNQRAVIQQQLQYSFEKRALADSVSNAKKEEIKNVEIAKQRAELKAKRNQQYMLFGGLGLVLIFAVFMYNRFRITARQKKEIEEQKLLVEEKQKEILDSIHYAKRIQKALMPSEKQIEKFMGRK
jgi:tetratricopeptide (TPR) repeat protein